MRVLQVVSQMNRGGIETWLMHVLRHVDRTRIAVDILCHTGERCAYDDEAESLGCRILRYTGSTKNVLRYASGLRRLLRRHGPYDVLHCHIHWYAAVALHAARTVGIPVRIAHSHNDHSRRLRETGFVKWCLARAARRGISEWGTHWLACSGKAGETYFGDACPWRCLYYGIDLRPFEGEVDGRELRQSLGIPADAIVAGHVSNFGEAKNMPFVVDVFAEIAKRQERARLLLVGDGPLRPAVEERARSLNVRDRTIFAGSRPDVARLMKGAMDAFLLPSLNEGLPLVAMEAQAAGLPCFLSDVISPETDVVPGAAVRMSLNERPSAWAERILRGMTGKKENGRNALAVLAPSPFNIVNGAAVLARLYRDAAGLTRET